jgi:hypothetical protein
MAFTMKNILMFITIFMPACIDVFAGEVITEKNWVSHPEIVEVRNIYQKVVELKNSGQLRIKERTFDTTDFPYEDDIRRLFVDKNNKPRIYTFEGGSDDSAVKREMFYDENGKLRFALIKAGAYNNTKIEHRIYFSKNGKKIWESRKLLEGPGYTFPHEWPDDELIQNPEQAFVAKSPCPEEKSIPNPTLKRAP